jgi:hypothetical protein
MAFHISTVVLLGVYHLLYNSFLSSSSTALYHGCPSHLAGSSAKAVWRRPIISLQHSNRQLMTIHKSSLRATRFSMPSTTSARTRLLGANFSEARPARKEVPVLCDVSSSEWVPRQCNSLVESTLLLTSKFMFHLSCQASLICVSPLVCLLF